MIRLMIHWPRSSVPLIAAMMNLAGLSGTMNFLLVGGKRLKIHLDTRLNKKNIAILPYSMLEYLTRQYGGVTVTFKIVLFTSTLRTAWVSRSKGIRNKADVVPVLQCFSTSHYRALPTMQSTLTAGHEYGWRIPGTSGTGYVGGTSQSSSPG